jgi:hypothetical protein
MPRLCVPAGWSAGRSPFENVVCACEIHTVPSAVVNRLPTTS